MTSQDSAVLKHEPHTFWQMLHIKDEYSGIFLCSLNSSNSVLSVLRCDVCAVSAGVTCETSHVNSVV